MERDILRNLTYETSNRAKTLRITVHPGGNVVVTTPSTMGRIEARKFAKEKLSWIQKHIERMRHEPVSLPDLTTRSVRHYQNHKERARNLLTRRLEYWNTFYGFRYNRISVKRHTTKWGSCSSKKNINFNYKILFLPKALQNYIVVHELCHIKELNHSERFWNLVAQTQPNYLTLRKKLNDYRL